VAAATDTGVDPRLSARARLMLCTNSLVRFRGRNLVTDSTLAGRGYTPRMRNRRLLQLRLTFSTAAAIFFLFQSLNAEFLRSAVHSRNIVVHVSIAIFGAAWLVQSFALIRQLYREDMQ
jgi:hypothetical protein